MAEGCGSLIARTRVEKQDGSFKIGHLGHVADIRFELRLGHGIGVGMSALVHGVCCLFGALFPIGLAFLKVCALAHSGAQAASFHEHRAEHLRVRMVVTRLLSACPNPSLSEMRHLLIRGAMVSDGGARICWTLCSPRCAAEGLGCRLGIAPQELLKALPQRRRALGSGLRRPPGRPVEAAMWDSDEGAGGRARIAGGIAVGDISGVDTGGLTGWRCERRILQQSPMTRRLGGVSARCLVRRLCPFCVVSKHAGRAAHGGRKVHTALLGCVCVAHTRQRCGGASMCRRPSRAKGVETSAQPVAFG